MRVLVIDDSAEIRSLLSLILKAKGHEIQTASDGKQGLTQLAKNFPDLILLDIKMPIMDGQEFLSLFFELYPDSKIPIILMSADDEESDRLATMSSGILRKPLEMDKLLNCISTLSPGH